MKEIRYRSLLSFSPEEGVLWPFCNATNTPPPPLHVAQTIYSGLNGRIDVSDPEDSSDFCRHFLSHNLFTSHASDMRTLVKYSAQPSSTFILLRASRLGSHTRSGHEFSAVELTTQSYFRPERYVGVEPQQIPFHFNIFMSCVVLFHC